MMKKANLVVAAFLLIVGAALAQHIEYAPFGHYTERVAEFEKQPRIMPTDVVMLGDSHTEFGGDWNKRLPGCGYIVNRGIAGDDAIGIGHRLKQICPYKPKAIVLECGINDLSHALTPQQVVANIAEVMDSIMRQCPKTRLYVMGVFPINMDVKRWKSLDGKTNQVAQLNNLLRAKCKERGVTFINIYNKLRIPGTNKLRKDCCRDGLHLTEKGYKIWSEALKLWLKQC